MLRRRKSQCSLSGISPLTPRSALGVGLGGYSLPARAQELVQRLGPVGPDDTILTTVGNKGVIAFYEPNGTHCSLYAVVFTLGDESGASATQVRMKLDARQIINIDGTGDKSLGLQCGDFAKMLSVVDPATQVAGASEE